MEDTQFRESNSYNQNEYNKQRENYLAYWKNYNRTPQRRKYNCDLQKKLRSEKNKLTWTNFFPTISKPTCEGCKQLKIPPNQLSFCYRLWQNRCKVKDWLEVSHGLWEQERKEALKSFKNYFHFKLVCKKKKESQSQIPLFYSHGGGLATSLYRLS